MKPIGPILKKHIEENGLVKKEVAANVGITYNYLSTIFQKDSIDCELLDRICVAIGLNPCVFFTTSPGMQTKNYSDISARTGIGNAEVQIGMGTNIDLLLEAKDRLIEEKERTISILLGKIPRPDGATTGH